MALGAFLARMVVGRSDFSLRAASEVLPMSDTFAVLFFVSAGMLLDPRHLLVAPGLVAATLGIILVGKPLAALEIVLLLGYPVKVALAVAVTLAQISEFSFILAALGKGLGLLTDAATNTLIAAAIVSITLNPLLYRLLAIGDRCIVCDVQLTMPGAHRTIRSFDHASSRYGRSMGGEGAGMSTLVLGLALMAVVLMVSALASGVVARARAIVTYCT
jgi:predicted Kef-type K+ transport protein